MKDPFTTEHNQLVRRIQKLMRQVRTLEKDNKISHPVRMCLFWDDMGCHSDGAAGIEQQLRQFKVYRQMNAIAKRRLKYHFKRYVVQFSRLFGVPRTDIL